MALASDSPMPSSTQVVELLARTADEAVIVGVAWHVVTLCLLLALAFGWRPTQRLCGWLLAAPLLSVAIVAAVFGNPFNALVFAGLALSSLLAGRLERRPVMAGARWQLAIGGAITIFGWAYPHFVVDEPAYWYAVATPTGVLPCPTLALVIGLGLVAGGLGSRAWSLVLALGGLFYGVTGAVVLGVTVDWLLVAGALALLTTALRRPHGDGVQSHRARKTLARPTAAAA